MAVVTIDERYRIIIPKEARAGLRPGDVLFVVQEESANGPVLRAAKPVNPFDALATAASAADERGETISLAEFARRHSIDLHVDD